MERWIQPETKFDGRIIRVIAGQIELDDGRPAYREVVEHGGGVCVLPYDGSHVTLVRQYRIAVGEYVLEAPAGKLEPGDTPLERARIELLEETGLQAAGLVELGYIYGTVGFCSERIHLYLALNSHLGEAKPETEERIEIVRLPLQEALERAAKGDLRDAKTLVLLMKLQHHVT
ncbi:MAG: NUDIX domain-containing protein [Candidatus Hydrogenedens sp.]|nr:NUDIX domain-containing protein [Candidatus Hydrogenedens sp.]